MDEELSDDHSYGESENELNEEINNEVRLLFANNLFRLKRIFF